MKVMVVPVTPYQQNSTVVICETTNRCAIVDPGGDVTRLYKAVEESGATVDKVLLTHGHLDHCAAAPIVAEHFGVEIFGPHREDQFWIDQLPMQCQMAGFPQASSFTPNYLDEGNEVELGNLTFQVLHCPGHTPGHIVFFEPSNKLAWVGDVLFQGSIGRTDFPRSHHQSLIDSIKTKLWPLGDDVQFIPGHGPTSTFGQERQSNPFVADARYR
jgi:glyoxylase-like metal-dependent hydrolase (beta-lactamase superfamily II)